MYEFIDLPFHSENIVKIQEKGNTLQLHTKNGRTYQVYFRRGKMRLSKKVIYLITSN